jgi:hypothetical protein
MVEREEPVPVLPRAWAAADKLFALVLFLRWYVVPAAGWLLVGAFVGGAVVWGFLEREWWFSALWIAAAVCGLSCWRAGSDLESR